MYAHFVRHISLPFYEWWHGTDVQKTIRSFEKSQWLVNERLRAIQWTRLSEMLAHAYNNVPYYRQQFGAMGATPEDIRSFEDFAQFPVLTKQTLQERLQDLVATNIPRSELFMGVTSGSSGRPTRYYQQISTNKIRKAAGRRLLKMSGYDFGLREFYFWRESQYTIVGAEVSPVAEQKSWPISPLRKLKEALYARFAIENPIVRVDPTLLTESEMAGALDAMRRFKPHIIVAYVNSLFRFAQFLDSQNVTDIRPRSIFVSSETLHPHQRDLMQKVFDCRVYNRYGLQETGIIAVECPVGPGLHINQEILHVEFQPSIANTLQLIVTDLINHAMPLLRYQTGDTGQPIDGSCSCGRGLARIDDIQGRIIDLLPTRSGGYVNGQLFATFHWIEGVRQYQVVQQTMSAFLIRIVRGAEFSEASLEPIVQTIREHFGDDTSVRIEYAESIPFTAGGKYRLVVSEVEKAKS